MPNIFDYNPANITPYPYWRWNKVLPAVYDDSMAQYEILCKLLYTVNEIISSENDMGTQVEQLTQLVQQLIDGEFPSGLVDYVEDIAEAAVADDISAINTVISAMQAEIDTLNSYVNPEDYLVFIGDSYLRGTGTTDGPSGGEGFSSIGNGWGKTLCTSEGIPQSHVMCIAGGGGGYSSQATNGGGLGLTYAGMIAKAANLMTAEQISRVRYVCILGGVNDGNSIVQSDIDATLSSARQLFPHKPIHVFTNLSSGTTTGVHHITEGNAKAYNMIKQRCAIHCCSFHETWLLGYASTSVYSDDLIHCSDNGYTWLGRAMYSAIHSGIIAPFQIGVRGFFNFVPENGVTMNDHIHYFDGIDYVQIHSQTFTVDTSVLPITGNAPITLATLPNDALAPRMTLQSFALLYGSAFLGSSTYSIIPVDLTNNGALRVRKGFCVNTSDTGNAKDPVIANFTMVGSANTDKAYIMIPSFTYKLI